MVRVEVLGTVVSLQRDQAERVKGAAAAAAGSSSRCRDLALVFGWAIDSPRVVVLRRSESRELIRLVRQESELSDVATLLGLREAA